VEAVLRLDPVGSLVIRGDLDNSPPGAVKLHLDDPDDPAGLLASSWWARITARDPAALSRLLPAVPARHPFEEDGELMFGGVAAWVRNVLAEAYEFTWENACWLYYLPGGATCPEDLPHDVRPLRSEDAPLVNEHWPHGDSEEYIAWRIEHGPTAAVFVDGRPVSWSITHGDDEMGLLTTLPEGRRRGYARSVTFGIVREIRARGKVPFLYTIQDNLPPQRLAESTGFVRHGAYHWFGARPTD
jgi:hypothetical protein